MRTTEQRMAEANRRAEKIKQQRRLRRDRLLGLGSVAASLVLIVGLALAWPGILSSLPGGEYDGATLAASIFGGGGGLGYVLIALLAFSLGVSVTLLCHHLHKRSREGRDD